MADRCTTFLTSLDILPTPPQQENSITKSQETPHARKLRKSPPLFSRFPIKPPESADAPEAKRQSTEFCRIGNPWDNYSRFTAEGTSRSTYLAFELTPSCSIVAIKESRKVPSMSHRQHIMKTSHTNIVNLKDAYIDGETIFFIYERMQLSIEYIHSSLQLENIHIATTCREV